ncbi:hypothetical protein WH47_06696, partial [Habropoda laboriosa]
EQYPCWIHCNGKTVWPSRSLDLISMDFCLRGHVISLVYHGKNANREQLKGKIIFLFEH